MPKEFRLLRDSGAREGCFVNHAARAGNLAENAETIAADPGKGTFQRNQSSKTRIERVDPCVGTTTTGRAPVNLEPSWMLSSETVPAWLLDA
jgi:hypothetical protein